MSDRLIQLMYQAWDDLDRAIDGLSTEEAIARHAVGSTIAWTVGHVTTQVDSWLNMRFQGLDPHPIFDREQFKTGASGHAENWQAILAGKEAVRSRARQFLESVPAPDLKQVVPYSGAIPALRETGLPLDYALTCIAAHHFHHVGEIVTIRSYLGHEIDESVMWGERLRIRAEDHL
jgi:uncharacterized damage-inducible protein DinB